MNRYENMTLADRYAAIKADMDALSKLLDEAKTEIKATGQEVVEGVFCTVEVALSERCCFDAKKAKTFLSNDEIDLCTKVSLVETLRVKAKLSA